MDLSEEFRSTKDPTSNNPHNYLEPVPATTPKRAMHESLRNEYYAFPSGTSVKCPTEDSLPPLPKKTHSGTFSTRANRAVQALLFKYRKPAKARLLGRPHSASYFLLRKIESRAVQLLLDIGCTTNLLRKQVFDQLPRVVRDQLKESDTHGLFDDRTWLLFYGMI